MNTLFFLNSQVLLGGCTFDQNLAKHEGLKSIGIAGSAIPAVRKEPFPVEPLQTFAAYNSCTQGRLGKLQGQGVTHFGGFVWRRILMEGCVTFFFLFLTHLAIQIHNT